MSKEKLPDGRIIEGGTLDVKGSIHIGLAEIKELKRSMYQDFLVAKQEGKIYIGYPFESWLRDSINTLRTLRKADIETEYKIGKISKSEYDALEEMRQKMISATLQMDTRDLDKFGIQYINPSVAQMASVNAQPLDNRLLIPNHRKDVIKFKRDKI